jgi:uncharacterized protein (TIGR04222 family)
LKDPYEVACLRGGVHAALRVAVVHLIDTGVLKVSGSAASGSGVTVAQAVEESPVNWLEELVWKKFKTPGRASDVFDLTSSALSLKDGLVSQGLLPDPGHLNARRGRKLAAALILGSVAFYRIVDALSHGRHNVLFLLALVILFGLAWFFYDPLRTPAGDRALAAMKTIYKGLKLRLPRMRRGQGSSELAMAAALFGFSALPAEFAYAKEIFPKAERGSGGGDGGSSSGCGSGCGSSGGSDGGSSGCGGCGGGGCGGGCGG